jgi:hypothetical protein
MPAISRTWRAPASRRWTWRKVSRHLLKPNLHGGEIDALDLQHQVMQALLGP